MIERGHRHEMTPVRAENFENGTIVIHMRCNSQPATASNPTPCALEEERHYVGEQLTKIRYRLHGVWFHPFDLIRTMPLEVQECSVCGGDDLIEPCEKCGGIGVEALDGGGIKRPDLHVAKTSL